MFPVCPLEIEVFSSLSQLQWVFTYALRVNGFVALSTKT